MLDLCQPLWSSSLIEEQLWFSEHDRDVDLWRWIIVACQPPCNQRFLSEFAQQWSSQGGWILNCLGNIQIQKEGFPLASSRFDFHFTFNWFPPPVSSQKWVSLQRCHSTAPQWNFLLCPHFWTSEYFLSTFVQISENRIEFLNCQDYVGLPTPSRNLNKSESCELCNTFHSPASFALTLWRTSEESLIHGIVFVHRRS